MLANHTSLTVNPMFLRHDLMIELGRLEAAIGGMRQKPANDSHEVAALETQRATISDTLRRLSV